MSDREMRLMVAVLVLAAVLGVRGAGAPWEFVPCDYDIIPDFDYQFGERAVRCLGDGCDAVEGGVTGMGCNGTGCASMRLFPPPPASYTLSWYGLRCTCDAQNDVIGCQVCVRADKRSMVAEGHVGSLLLAVLLGLFGAVAVWRMGPVTV